MNVFAPDIKLIFWVLLNFIFLCIAIFLIVRLILYFYHKNKSKN